MPFYLKEEEKYKHTWQLSGQKSILKGSGETENKKLLSVVIWEIFINVGS